MKVCIFVALSIFLFFLISFRVLSLWKFCSCSVLRPLLFYFLFFLALIQVSSSLLNEGNTLLKERESERKMTDLNNTFLLLFSRLCFSSFSLLLPLFSLHLSTFFFLLFSLLKTVTRTWLQTLNGLPKSESKIRIGRVLKRFCSRKFCSIGNSMKRKTIESEQKVEKFVYSANLIRIEWDWN